MDDVPIYCQLRLRLYQSRLHICSYKCSFAMLVRRYMACALYRHSPLLLLLLIPLLLRLQLDTDPNLHTPIDVYLVRHGRGGTDSVVNGCFRGYCADLQSNNYLGMTSAASTVRWPKCG